MPARKKQRFKRTKQVFRVVIISFIAVLLVLAFMPGLFLGSPGHVPVM